MRRLDRWSTCRACKLHAHRRNVVLGRGDAPAPLLFLGIGPGKSEDLRGLALVGRSDWMFRHACADALALVGLARMPRHYVTNLVACRPCDGPSERNRDPTLEEMIACRPRLAETISLVAPNVVVFLGDLAEQEGKQLCPDGVKLRHPAYLLRAGSRGGAEYKRFVRDMSAVLGRVDV